MEHFDIMAYTSVLGFRSCRANINHLSSITFSPLVSISPCGDPQYSQDLGPLSLILVSRPPVFYLFVKARFHALLCHISQFHHTSVFWASPLLQDGMSRRGRDHRPPHRKYSTFLISCLVRGQDDTSILSHELVADSPLELHTILIRERNG